MADFDESNRYDDDRAYDRRSASPRGDREDRNRSRSPIGRDRPPPPPGDTRMKDSGDEEEAVNPGTNLFVTGIHPRLTESDVSRLFDKYGEVESCSIMLDPHTKESRGFGFVKMMQSDQADAAKEGLQGEVIEGRTLSIEKARRARPRTPTPGKYFGPPKRGDFGGPRRGGFRGDRGRYDEYDRRGYAGGGRRDDYRSGGYERGGYDRDEYRGGSRGDRGRYDEYDRRGYGGGRRDRERERDDGYGAPRIDRYEGRREEGYTSRDRRGGGYGGYERSEDRGFEAPAAAAEAPRESYRSGRGDYSRDDRYGAR